MSICQQTPKKEKKGKKGIFLFTYAYSVNKFLNYEVGFQKKAYNLEINWIFRNCQFWKPFWDAFRLFIFECWIKTGESIVNGFEYV